MYKNNFTFIRGFSLLELMLAMTLGSALMCILFTYYSLFEKIHHDIQEESLQMENARFTIYFLFNFLRYQRNVLVLPIDGATTTFLRVKEKSDAVQIRKLVNDAEIISFLYLSKISPDITAFFYKQANKPRIEIARGIDQLTIEYGIKCLKSNNICMYLTGKSIRDFSQIRSVLLTFTQKRENGTLKTWRFYSALNSS